MHYLPVPHNETANRDIVDYQRMDGRKKNANVHFYVKHS